MSLNLTPSQLALAERTAFRNVFLSTQDGLEVLTWIGNECAAWSQDPAKINPDLLALWNRLLGKLGIVTATNLFEITKGLAQAANDNDIALERRQDGRGTETGTAGE